MTKKAEKKRGYNQSQILSTKLSALINVPVLEAVKKVKETERQATLSRAQRLKNLDNAFRVVDKKDGSRKRVSPIFVMKEYRNKGLAQKTFEEIEKIHGCDNWELATILQEEGNCYLYEKLGYKRTGTITKINDRMDIIGYEKI